MLHQTFKLFLQAIILEVTKQSWARKGESNVQVASLSCMVTAYGKYASNGVGFPLVKLIGQLLR